MTKEELVRQAAKCLPSKFTTVKEEKEFIDGFVRGVEWMQERMIEKAAEWLYIYYSTLDRSKSFEDAWKHFKRAMEEEK